MRAGALVALIALGVVVALAGCAQSGAESAAPAKRVVPREASESTVGVTASDIALLTQAYQAKGFDEPLARRIARRIDELERQLAAAPFMAEPALSLPGTFSAPAVPQPPKGNATRPDAFEPEGLKSGASVLHIGETQIRTIDSTRDQDWVSLPNAEGEGYFRLVANGPVSVWKKTSPAEPDVEWSEESRDPIVMAAVPRRDARGSTATLFQIVAKGPTVYSVSRVATEPPGLVGDTDVEVSSITFGDAVGTLDVGAYYLATGRKATKAQLLQFQRALFGSVGKWGAGHQQLCIYSPPMDMRAMPYPGPPPAPSHPTQRSYATTATWESCAADPLSEVGYWTCSVWRGRRWVVVSAGRDVTYERSPFVQMAEMASRLMQSPAMPIPGSMKPVIYLYPTREESVTVGLGFQGQLTSTTPVIDRETHTWTVTARRGGKLIDTAGRQWPYLFWEGLGGLPLFDLTQGTVVRGREADGYLRAALAERGLSDAENAEFREFWVPRLSANPWVLIHFAGLAYENSVPLKVTPRPDVSIRVYMVAKPLAAPVPVTPQRLAPPPKRRGFTLVEWGGTILP